MVILLRVPLAGRGDYTIGPPTVQTFAQVRGLRPPGERGLTPFGSRGYGAARPWRTAGNPPDPSSPRAPEGAPRGGTAPASHFDRRARRYRRWPLRLVRT